MAILARLLSRLCFCVVFLFYTITIRCDNLSLSSSLPSIQHLKYYQLIQFFNTSVGNFQQGKSVYVEFNAFNTTFKLTLQTDTTIFSNDSYLELENYPGIFGQFDHLRLVSGSIKGSDNSYAFGYVNANGSYQGVIYTNNTVYYVEWIRLYLNQWTNQQQYIIYRDIDIGNPSLLGQKSIISNTGDDNNQVNSATTSTTTKQNQNNQNKIANPMEKSLIPLLLGNKTKCLAQVDIDRAFMLYYQNNFAYAIADVAILMQMVNQIYRRTDFDQDGKADGFGISIQSLAFESYEESINFDDNDDSNITKSAMNTNLSQLSNITNPVQFFNKLTTTKNYSDSCLGLYLTGQQFDNSVLGMANSGYKNDEGICTNYYYNEDFHVASGNVAVVSINDQNGMIPFATRQIAIGHEVGHLFGSLHDTNGSLCSPNNHFGNYLMYEQLVDGSKRNNFHFSSCSRNEIKQNVIMKTDRLKSCLLEEYFPLCGNGIIDEGEECDCGYKSKCQDPCCNAAYQFPRDVPSISQVGYYYVPCRKNNQATCSNNSAVPIEAIGISVTFGLPIILVFAIVVYKQLKNKLYIPLYGEAGTSRSSHSDCRQSNLSYPH